MLKTFLLATAASFALMTGAQATVLPMSQDTVTGKAPAASYLHHTKSGNSGSGKSGSGNSGGDDNDSNDDSGNDGGGDDGTPDQGGGNDDDNDDNDVSGRDKPRIPGGSGCDDPGDAEEHASCSPGSL